MKSTVWLIFAFLGMVWGFNSYCIQVALPYLSPIEAVWWRVAGGLVPLLVFAIAKQSLSKQHWRYTHHFIVMSLLNTSLHFILYAHGTQYLPSGIAGVLGASIPLFTFVSSMIFLRQESIHGNALIGMALSTIGIVFIAQPWNDQGQGLNLEGVWAVLAGCLLIGLSFVYARKYLAPLDINPTALSTYQMVFAFATMLLLTPTSNLGNVFQSSFASTALILGAGALGTGLAYVAYYYLIEKMGAVLSSTVTYIPPMVALAAGYVLADETINWVQGIGVTILLVGVAFIQFGKTWFSKWFKPSLNTASESKPQ